MNFEFKNKEEFEWQWARAARLTDANEWFRIWCPYRYLWLPSDRFKFVYLPVNRNYKPLGIISRDYVDYLSYVDQAVVFDSDPSKFQNIWYRPERRTLSLYSDDPLSRLDYVERFTRLLTKRMRIFGRIEPTKHELRKLKLSSNARDTYDDDQ